MKITRHRLRRIIKEAIRESLNLDISNHKPMIRKLMKMEPTQAWELVKSLSSSYPGLEDSYIISLEKRWNELNDDWDFLPPMGGELESPNKGTTTSPTNTLDQMQEISDIVDEYNQRQGLVGEN